MKYIGFYCFQKEIRRKTYIQVTNQTLILSDEKIMYQF
jgi:hypothetical protein